MRGWFVGGVVGLLALGCSTSGDDKLPTSPQAVTAEDAGSSTPPPTADAGTTQQPPSDGGAISPPPSTDAGTPPPVDACLGFRSSILPAPTRHVFNNQEDESADGLLDADGEGNVALSTARSTTPPGENFSVFSSTGTLLGAFGGFSAWQIAAQASGFVTFYSGTPGTFLVANSPDGSVETSTQLDDAYLMSNDPTGGVALVSSSRGLLRFDASGVVRSATPLPSNFGSTETLGVDRLGNALLLSGGNPGNAVWVSASGTVGTVFQVARKGSGSLEPRVGGGLFLEESGQWSWQVDTLATQTRDPPLWLAQRPNVNLHMAYGGKAYAAMNVTPSGSTCTAFIEVLSATGDSCATLLLPNSCDPINVGYDGTILQASHEEANQECASWEWNCSVWQWWPASSGVRVNSRTCSPAW